MKTRTKFLFFAAATAALSAVSSAWATDTAWRGGEGSWTNAEMWDNGVPTVDNGNKAILTAGGTINFGNSVSTISSIGWINGGADKPFEFTADSDDAGLTILAGTCMSAAMRSPIRRHMSNRQAER